MKTGLTISMTVLSLVILFMCEKKCLKTGESVVGGYRKYILRAELALIELRNIGLTRKLIKKHTEKKTLVKEVSRTLSCHRKRILKIYRILGLLRTLEWTSFFMPFIIWDLRKKIVMGDFLGVGVSIFSVTVIFFGVLYLYNDSAEDMTEDTIREILAEGFNDEDVKTIYYD